MRAYMCVYRHSALSRSDRDRTERETARNPLLRTYLDQHDSPRSVLDWGDDPSFFGASTLLGDVRRATWGVCRRDIRAALAPGDFVVFLCGRQDGPIWDYHFVGVATVGKALTREQTWSDDRYAVYRGFFNILARPGIDGLEPYECIHRFHPDWRHRIRSPIWRAAEPESMTPTMESRRPTVAERNSPSPGSADCKAAAS